MKNSLKCLNSRFEPVEDTIDEAQDRSLRLPSLMDMKKKEWRQFDRISEICGATPSIQTYTHESPSIRGDRDMSNKSICKSTLEVITISKFDENHLFTPSRSLIKANLDKLKETYTKYILIELWKPKKMREFWK